MKGLKTLSVLAVVAGILPGCGFWGSSSGGSSGTTNCKAGKCVNPNPGHLELTHEFYSSCGELQQNVVQRFEDYKLGASAQAGRAETTSAQADMAMPSGSSKASQAGSANNQGQTNVQVKGVDEGDFVKVGTHHIFVRSGNSIQVVEKKKGGAIIGQIPLSPLSNPQANDALALTSVNPNGRVSSNSVDKVDLMVFQNGLAIVTSNWQTTSIELLDASVPNVLPTKKARHLINGRLSEIRLAGNKLVVVMQDRLPINNDGYSRPEKALDIAHLSSVQGVACTSIAKPIVKDLDFSLSKVAAFDVTSPEAAPQVLALPGIGEKVYMTDKSIFLFRNASSLSSSSIQEKAASLRDAFQPSWWSNAFEGVVMAKIDFNSDAQPSGKSLFYTATGVVPGRVKDQWAFHEFSEQGALAVATTTGQLWSDDPATMAKNHLWVLQNEGGILNVKASVRDFGKKEDIRAIRYLGKTAYVVTFKKTDPLFAIDISNPLDPKILGELKVPGFSTYLHPVAPGRVVGIGFDAADQGDFAFYQGIQVSLFDVSNPMQMTRLDNKIYGTRGSQSAVNTDHKAFFYDPESRIMALSITELESQSSVSGYGSSIAFSGVILLRVNDSGFEEIARLSHFEHISENCKKQMAYGSWWQTANNSGDVSRLLRLGNDLLTVSANALKWHPVTAPANTDAHVSFNLPDQCAPIQYPMMD